MVTILLLLMLKISSFSLLNKSKEMRWSLMAWMYHWHFPGYCYLTALFFYYTMVQPILSDVIHTNSAFQVSQTAKKLHAWQELPPKMCHPSGSFQIIGDYLDSDLYITSIHSTWSRTFLPWMFTSFLRFFT